ncbi:LysR substrate-binding domain-containing protein, partial [Roseateles sp. GG27B]
TDGAAYLANVRIGLAALQQMPSRSAGKGTTRLRVAVTPTFCRQFVMPRLEQFRNAYPDIELILQVSIPLLDVTAED